MLSLARHPSLAGPALLIALLASSGTGNAQATNPECFVELPVFDPLGVKVPFQIIEARAHEDDGPNLLASPREDGPRIGESDRLYFPRTWIGSGLVYVTLKAVHQEKLKEALGLTRLGRPLTLKASLVISSCQQRTSLRVGEKDTNFDVMGSMIEGRIGGGQVDGDWWIRAMPMFGGHNERSVYEGFIHPTDGSFSLTAHMRGERHILIVGKGRHPLTAIGVDVTAGGGKTDVGVLDLSAKCPK